MYEHLLVPSDGSELAQVGVDHGLALARQHGAKVTAVTVTGPIGGQFGFSSDLWTPSDEEIAAYDAEQREMAERVLSAIKEQADAMGVPIETIHVPNRLTSSALLKLADELCCSAIVMSSHGRTGLNRAMLGSQASAVSAAAKVPVIIVR